VKPADAAEARAMLRGLAGRAHDVLSGIALAGPHGTVSAVTRTRVWMRPFDDGVAAAYVATGEPLDKAGAYGIQGGGAALVERIDGDYYSVVGFPVAAFLDLLERAGWRFAFGAPTRLDPV
jgi:septum formation protein